MEQFDFRKPEDQKRFDRLPETKREELKDLAHEEAKVENLNRRFDKGLDIKLGDRDEDRETIKKVVETKRDFGDRTFFEVIKIFDDFINAKPKFIEIKERVGKYSLVNLGCGENGFHDASLSIDAMHSPKVELVEPYKEFLDLMRKANVKKTLSHLKNNTIEFYKIDGLTFLKQKEGGSSNILVSSIDFALINDQDYLKRIAQEAYRVAPEDGFLICMNSPEIEREAKTLFPFSSEIGGAWFFSKTAFLPEDLSQGIEK